MRRQWPLTKSKIISFLQCPKWLWLEVHKPNEKDETEEMQARFLVGHHVGDIARTQYPKGVLIEHPDNFNAAIAATQAAMSSRIPVFEAAFQHDNVRVRTDLILPKPRSWHTAEVKSAGEVKDHHLNDLAVQTSVLKNAGIRVSRSTIRHINKQFVYPGGGNYRGLLTDAEADREVKELLPEVRGWVAAARKTLSGREPGIEMGKHCNDPWACPFQGYCTKLAGTGPAYPVDLLPRGRSLVEKLKSEGYDDLREVPADRMTTDLFRRIHAATKTGKPYVDREGAHRAMSSWKYPRAYLDFETIGFAVPIWEGTRPFQQIPFQWSCHIERPDGAVTHREFLDLSGNNPARACAEKLVKGLRGCRMIIAHHAGVERNIMRGLAATFPDLRAPLLRLAEVVVDLLPVVKEHYYHRDMLGSYSIKAILPALAPRFSYDNLDEVTDGLAAQRAYAEAIHPATPDSRKVELERKLRRYCALDSEGMIAVARRLTK